MRKIKSDRTQVIGEFVRCYAPCESLELIGAAGFSSDVKSFLLEVVCVLQRNQYARCGHDRDPLDLDDMRKIKSDRTQVIAEFARCYAPCESLEVIGAARI